MKIRKFDKVINEEIEYAEYIDRELLQDCIERMKFYPDYTQRLKDFNLMFPLKKGINGVYRRYEEG